MLHAEFEGLKDELERLLCRNRGLTRASSPRTAAVSSRTSDSSRSCSDRDTESSVHSRHSSSHSQSSSCSSFSGMLLGQANSQPTSVAERASQQLNHDVDILLKQVDDVMAAPVLQLPAWFSKKPVAPTCTVTELPEAHQTPPAAHSTHRIVTPKLKANSVSTADSRTSACQDITAATDTATSAAQHQQTKACSAWPAALKSAQGTAAGQGTGRCLSSTSAADTMLASEPDNLTILHVACATTPSQSDDTATTSRSGHQAQTDTLPSPKEWHTNHMADSGGSVSSTGGSTHPAAAAVAAAAPAWPADSSARSVAAAAAAWSADSSAADTGISVMHEAGSSRRRRGSKDTSKGLPHRSKGRRAPGGTHPNSPSRKNQDELTDPEHDQDELHRENVAPGWHRQPLQNLMNSDAVPAKLAQPEGSAEAGVAGGPAGQGGLMEGYLRGSSAKLQLPAAVRCGSRKSAITARTPLKTITEVWHYTHCTTTMQPCMETGITCLLYDFTMVYPICWFTGEQVGYMCHAQCSSQAQLTVAFNCTH